MNALTVDQDMAPEGLKPGDEVELAVTGTVKSIGENGLVVDVTNVQNDAEEDQAEQSGGESSEGEGAGMGQMMEVPASVSKRLSK